MKCAFLWMHICSCVSRGSYVLQLLPPHSSRATCSLHRLFLIYFVYIFRLKKGTQFRTTPGTHDRELFLLDGVGVCVY